MRVQLLIGLRIFLAVSVIAGLAYPLLSLGAAQALFPAQANGSLVRREGVVVGSALLGQPFRAPGAFHPRPSAAGEGYDGASSGASNLGPTNPDLLAVVGERAAAYREENGLAADEAVPVDAVTASGSGLDPHISLANARLQAPRVAEARGLEVERVLQLVSEATEGPGLAVLGDPGVDVLALNLALDSEAAR